MLVVLGLLRFAYSVRSAVFSGDGSSAVFSGDGSVVPATTPHQRATQQQLPTSDTQEAMDGDSMPKANLAAQCATVTMLADAYQTVLEISRAWVCGDDDDEVELLMFEVMDWIETFWRPPSPCPLNTLRSRLDALEVKQAET